MDMMNDGYGSMMGGMWFFSILFWILVIAGMVFITKWFLERNEENRESALDILNKRYAKGEIDRETFERMKKDIAGGG